ncbi:SMI1/KNR4 family protein [Myroides pelagicus]|uniref:SMI1/KNR4 family protein n=1 Tax=Myroides pelagicus TaxID=270914 RepID=A0A7K1GMP7_9FLAO|nr:SMI1/KNR4 family protein [Myroides pelagicus]MEC4113107.1 SMI1/KNR4 family protein [Myroides pelagicus]MTH30010.1 SMI1/KNR4 family protein [Myroides pelagicus]
MEFPKVITDFVAKEAECDHFFMPQFYPKAGDILSFQRGYKYNSNTGEDITGVNVGDFHPNWYVICGGYAQDPFWIDITEGDKGFPVYFGEHGAGRWKSMKVAPTLEEFEKCVQFMNYLVDLEETREVIEPLFNARFDRSNSFWELVWNEFPFEE